MMSIYNLTCVIAMVTAMVTMAVLTVHTRRNRESVAGADSFMYVTALISVYTVLEIMVYLSSSTSEALFWFNLRFIPIAFAPVFILKFVAAYSGRGDPLSRRVTLLLLIVPVVTQVMVWSNNFHHLWVVHNPGFYRAGNFFFADTSLRVLGPWIKVHYIYSYFLTVAGLVYLFYSAFRSHGLFRKKTFLLGTGFSLIVAGSFFPAVSFFPGMKAHPLPHATALGSLVIAFGVWRFEINENNPVVDRGKTYPLALIWLFVVMATGIIAGAYINFTQYREYHVHGIKEQLAAVADLKMNEIARWRSERLGDGDILINNSLFYSLLGRYYSNPSDPVAAAPIELWFKKLIASYSYKEIILCDRNGRKRLSVPHNGSYGVTHPQVPLNNLRENKSSFLTEIHQSAAEYGLHLSVIVPLWDDRKSELLYGFIVMMINPYDYLFPMLANWPGSCDTAETILVRREGERLLFMSETRFRKDAVMNLSIPADKIPEPPHIAADDKWSFSEGIDYRGEPVITSLRSVPGAQWSMIVKIDTAEVYDPVKSRFWIMVFIIIVSVSAAGTVVGLIWRRKSESFYREQYIAGEKLRESEEKFRSMVEIAPEPIFIQISGRFAYANPAAKRLYGVDNGSEITGESVIDRIHPDFREKVFHRIYTLNVERKPVNQLLEMKLVRFDGSEVWVETAGVPIVYNGEEGALVFVRNIHERKLAEEKVKQSEERYRHTLENMIEGAQIIDFNWRYIYLNRAAEVHGRRNLDELIGQCFTDVWPGIESTDLYKKVSQCMHERVPVQMENLFIFPDGSEGWFNLSIQPVPEGVFILSIDITERRRAEEEVRKAYDRMNMMYSSNVVGIVIADPHGRLLEVNDYYLELIGYSREDFNNGSIRWDSITPPEHLQSDMKAIEELRERGSCTPYRKEYIRKDGDRVWVLLADVLLPGPGENIFGIVIDITEKKKAELELQLSLQQKSDLIREVYHRTKNSLQVILSLFSLQSIRSDDEKLSLILHDMENRIRAMALVHEKLYKSKNLSRINLGEYLSDLIDMIICSPATANREIEVRKELPDIDVLIDTAIPCGLVLNELVSNAFKHAYKSSDPGELSVVMSVADNGAIEFSVSDNGCGIPENSDVMDIGGLGLQIVYTVVQYQLNGIIKLERNPGVKWIISFKDNMYSERV